MHCALLHALRTPDWGFGEKLPPAKLIMGPQTPQRIASWMIFYIRRLLT